MNKRTAAALAALAVGLVVAVGAAPGTAAPAVTARLVMSDDDRALNAVPAGLGVCNGGAQEQSFVRSDDTPTRLVENAGFAPLPGAQIVVNTPAGDVDQILVLLTAEARMDGQPLTYVTPVDFLQVRIVIDGIAVGSNDLTFTTGAGESDATQACKRVSAPVGAGMAHTVSVEWLLVDQGANNVLTGFLDDWTLSVQVSN